MYGRYTKDLGEFAKDEARKLKILETVKFMNHFEIPKGMCLWLPNENKSKTNFWNSYFVYTSLSHFFIFLLEVFLVLAQRATLAQRLAKRKFQ